MSDWTEALRRKWQETRSVDDDAAFLKAVVGSGGIDPQRVEMAAGLGHAGACGSGIAEREIPEHYRTIIEEAAKLISHKEAVAFALECASRVLKSWETQFPSDKRPREAIEAARLWLDGKVDADFIKAAWKAATKARQDADDPEQVPGNDPLTRAVHTATSAELAVQAVKCAAGFNVREEDEGFDGVVFDVGHCVRYALRAAGESEDERRWQLARLADYLLERA